MEKESNSIIRPQRHIPAEIYSQVLEKYRKHRIRKQYHLNHLQIAYR